MRYEGDMRSGDGDAGDSDVGYCDAGHLDVELVYGYPRDPLTIVVAWVPNMGVYNQFLGACGLI